MAFIISFISFIRTALLFSSWSHALSVEPQANKQPRRAGRKVAWAYFACPVYGAYGKIWHFRRIYGILRESKAFYGKNMGILSEILHGTEFI